jgi:hypothetical protein
MKGKACVTRKGGRIVRQDFTGRTGPHGPLRRKLPQESCSGLGCGQHRSELASASVPQVMHKAVLTLHDNRAKVTGITWVWRRVSVDLIFNNLFNIHNCNKKSDFIILFSRR